MQIKICRLNAVDIGQEAIKRAETAYASWTLSADLLREAYPDGELNEDFPRQDTNRLPMNMEGYQTETDPPEIMVTDFFKIPNITAGATAKTMKEFPALWELPFNKDTKVYLTTLAYFLSSFGCHMKLDKCNLETLETVLTMYSQKPIVAFKKRMDKDLCNDQIMILYKVWPVVLARTLHHATMTASINLRRIDHANKWRGQKNREKEAVTDILLRNLMALSILYFVNA